MYICSLPLFNLGHQRNATLTNGGKTALTSALLRAAKLASTRRRLKDGCAHVSSVLGSAVSQVRPHFPRFAKTLHHSFLGSLSSRTQRIVREKRFFRLRGSYLPRNLKICDIVQQDVLLLVKTVRLFELHQMEKDIERGTLAATSHPTDVPKSSAAVRPAAPSTQGQCCRQSLLPSARPSLFSALFVVRLHWHSADCRRSSMKYAALCMAVFVVIMPASSFRLSIVCRFRVVVWPSLRAGSSVAAHPILHRFLCSAVVISPRSPRPFPEGSTRA